MTGPLISSVYISYVLYSDFSASPNAMIREIISYLKKLK